jgi:hypothetical protein
MLWLASVRRANSCDYPRDMTRDEAITVGIFALAGWHHTDHGDLRICIEAEQFGAQAAAVVDGLAAGGVAFDGYSAADRGPLGPPG